MHIQQALLEQVNRPALTGIPDQHETRALFPDLDVTRVQGKVQRLELADPKMLLCHQPQIPTQQRETGTTHLDGRVALEDRVRSGSGP